MVTPTNDWLEIMKKPAPISRFGLNRIEKKLFSAKKQRTSSLKLLLSFFGIGTLCFALLSLNNHFDFLNTFFAAPVVMFIIFSPFFIFLNCLYLLGHFMEVRSIEADKKKYLEQHGEELKNADAIEYNFERLKNTVANHIRQLSELDILQILKDNDVQSWAKDLLQKELDQRTSAPLVVDCALETYNQVCQKTPILRI